MQALVLKKLQQRDGELLERERESARARVRAREREMKRERDSRASNRSFSSFSCVMVSSVLQHSSGVSICTFILVKQVNTEVKWHAPCPFHDLSLLPPAAPAQGEYYSISVLVKRASTLVLVLFTIYLIYRLLHLRNERLHTSTYVSLRPHRLVAKPHRLASQSFMHK